MHNISTAPITEQTSSKPATNLEVVPLRNLYDMVQCSACCEITPFLEHHRCIYCESLLEEDEPRIERRFRVRIQPLPNRQDGQRAAAWVLYFGLWIGPFIIIDEGYPSHPEVDFPRIPTPYGKSIRAFYFKERHDLTDVVDSILEAYEREIGLVRELRPITGERR